ncbi:DUF4062 domain-containing protein [Candidatus Uabimicrobium sp. HlEnr_7]|uniref:DUF4062 domain-containing protein n=1 Tax=Candidatus Uabimicrobium helgolandensis TaxID=3095367 RepID=UPI003555C3B2
MYIWKTAKVFVSSTFKDLELERDRMTNIFREIQQNVYDRQLHILSYDLRWRDRRNDQNIVEWCLEMVDRSQYFVGILGERYGWCPEHDRYNEKNIAHISITEMEINSALETIEPHRRFFCFTQDSENTPQKLKELKKRLIASKERIYYYSSLEELIDITQTELQNILDKDFPPRQIVPIEEYTREQALQEIIDEKVRGFVGRDKYLQLINNFCKNQDDKNYLLIEAVAGTGKSALLSQFLKHVSDKKVVGHYMNMAGDSRTFLGILQSLSQQLQKLNIIDEDLETAPSLLSAQIRNALQKNHQPLIIAIDGLDEMDEHNFSWLPKWCPPQTRVIITTRPIEEVQIVKTFLQVVCMELLPLEEQEIYEIISLYEKQHSLVLKKEEREALVQRAAGNPLFLKVALDEIVAGGIAVGQLAQTVETLFHQIVKRLQDKYEANKVNCYLGVIAASRYGLAEVELHEILLSEYQEQISDDFLLELSKSLANFIIFREQLLNFFHPEFERSIKMLLGKGGMRKYHETLAKYFAGKKYSYDRALLEIPYQLLWAEQYELLLRTFADIHFLEAKCSQNMVADLDYNLQMAIDGEAASIPQDLEVEIAPKVVMSRSILSLLRRILQMDIQFLSHYGQHLLQSLWNRGFWHDSPEAKDHYCAVNEGPWDKQEPKLHTVVSYWREQKQLSGNKCAWVQSLRPLPARLDSPLTKTFRGHSEEIMCVCITFDGHKIVSAGQDGCIKVWDIESGRCLVTIDQPDIMIREICVTGDDKKIISVGEDNDIYIWHLLTGELWKTLTGHSDSVKSVHIQKNRIASGGRDGKICLWDLETGECLKTFYGYSPSVTSIFLTNDLQRIISSGDDKTIRIWDIAEGKHSTIVTNAAVESLFLQDNYLVAGMEDGTISLWNLNTHNIIFDTKGHKTSVVSVCIDVDKKRIVSGSWDHLVKVWDIEREECVLELRGHEEWVSSVACHHKMVVSGSYDNTIRVWDTSIEIPPLTLKGHTEVIESVAMNAHVAVTGSRDRSTGIWNLTNGTFRSLEEDDCVMSVYIDDDKIFSGLENKTVSEWNIDQPTEPKKYQGHRSMVWCVGGSADGKRMASGSADETVRLWNTKNNECLGVFKGHKDHVTAVCMNENGRILISGGGYLDKKIRIWDSEQQQCICSLVGHKSSINGIAIIDQNTIVSCSDDKTIRIWDVPDRKCTSVIHGIAKVEQWSRKQSYYAVMRDTDSIVVCKESGDEVVAFPMVIEQIDLVENGIITGKISDYLYILKLHT